MNKPAPTPGSIVLKQSEFQLFSKLVYKKCGINLPPHKITLVQNRLGKRIHQLKYSSFKEYYQYVTSDKSGSELVGMIDSISTNVTHFFREKQHFDMLREMVIPEMLNKKTAAGDIMIRVWCAASSSGEEPYTLAITFMEGIKNLSNYDFKILGSDISTRMLQQAEQGIYHKKRVDSIPANLRLKYFDTSKLSGEKRYIVKSNVKKNLVFRRINLLDEFPFNNPIDIIFCRNVMIYFDKPTQERVVTKFYRHLRSGGYLFVGHSEGLNGVSHRFQYVQPSVYRKE